MPPQIAPTFTLMYHRVCDRNPQTEAYFRLGTAIAPEVFRRQLEWLAERFLFCAPSEIFCGGGRARCVLTFDDAYCDADEIPNLPPCAIFPIAAHMGDSEEAASFDSYYGILATAKRRSEADIGEVCRILGIAELHSAPPLDDGMNWWIRGGPVKRALKSAPVPIRRRALFRLAEILRGRLPSASSLYLTANQLSNLAKKGCHIGGHGETHRPLTILSRTELTAEIEASRRFARRFHRDGEIAFCYPDGKNNNEVRRSVGEGGFAFGFTTQHGVALEHADRFALPRIWMRNVNPNDDEFPLELRVA